MTNNSSEKVKSQVTVSMPSQVPNNLLPRCIYIPGALECVEIDTIVDLIFFIRWKNGT